MSRVLFARGARPSTEEPQALKMHVATRLIYFSVLLLDLFVVHPTAGQACCGYRSRQRLFSGESKRAT